MIKKNSRKILHVYSEKKAYKVFGPIWDEKVPFLSKKNFFENIHYCCFCFLTVPYYCTKLKKSLEWILRTKVFSPI